MPQDDLDHIPPIVATRDTVPRRDSARNPTGGAGERRRRTAGPAPKPGGSGLLARLATTVALVVAAVACAWAWQLQGQLQLATDQMGDYAARIGDLEARLSDTDEGMNQNAAVQAVKVAELESEVRKLWDNVWKQTRKRLDKLEASGDGYEKSIKSMDASLKSASGDLARLKSVSGDLARLTASTTVNQAEVERVADALNRINLDLARLNKRLEREEEWVGSVDAFRKQVNASLTELEAAVRTLQASR